MKIDIQEIDFEKVNGLVPAVIQDSETLRVLMLGYMNDEAVEKTIKGKKVTFFSRIKNRLWTKGEESGNFLELVDIKLDCDSDTLLIKVKPQGPVCHTGNDTCWEEKNEPKSFLFMLEKILESRKNADPNTSYTASLFAKGINKIAQKVGEEAIELIIESKDENEDLFLNEAADLFYHYVVLLKYKGYSLSDVENILSNRHR